MRAIGVAIVLLGVGLASVPMAGCRNQPDLMPLRVGRKFNYAVLHGVEHSTTTVQVAREVPISGSTGYEMEGPMGVTRLGWVDGVLVVSQSSNGTFDPPIPWLAADSADRSWEGRVGSLANQSKATAKLTHEPAELRLTTRTFKTTKASLVIKMPRGTIEVVTWFAPGIGIVRQDQHTNERLVVSMSILGSPEG